MKSVHGSDYCTERERFRCRGCRRRVCWCMGASGFSRLECGVCSECWCKLGPTRWLRVALYQWRREGGYNQAAQEAIAKHLGPLSPQEAVRLIRQAIELRKTVAA